MSAPSISEGQQSEAESYELCEAIGYGASAVAWRARVKRRSRAEKADLPAEVAIKRIDLENCPSNLGEIRKEIQAMEMCNHPNIVEYYCCFVSSQELWLVMEYLAGGSVLDIMKFAHPTGIADEAMIATILRGALMGLQYLHGTGRIHRDVKAGNILLGGKGEVKLADFGVSAWLVEDGQRRDVCQTFVGTPCWMAPEVMEQVKGYTYSADIWSYGITSMEMAKGQAPLAKHPPMKVLLLTLRNPAPSLGATEKDRAKYSKPFREMTDMCLQKDPEARPSAAKLLEHRFFKGAKKADYIVSGLLKRLPPLSERAEVIRQKRRVRNKKEEEERKPISGKWVFPDDDEEEDAANPHAGSDSPAVAIPLSKVKVPQSPAVDMIEVVPGTSAPSSLYSTPIATFGRFTVTSSNPSVEPASVTPIRETQGDTIEISSPVDGRGNETMSPLATGGEGSGEQRERAKVSSPASSGNGQQKQKTVGQTLQLLLQQSRQHTVMLDQISRIVNKSKEPEKPLENNPLSTLVSWIDSFVFKIGYCDFRIYFFLFQISFY